MEHFSMDNIINNMIYFSRKGKEVSVLLITGIVTEITANSEEEAKLVEELLLKKDTETVLDITVKFRGYS